MNERELQILNVFAQLGLPAIKPEQLQVVKGILQRDVFTVLSIGYALPSISCLCHTQANS